MSGSRAFLEAPEASGPVTERGVGPWQRVECGPELNASGLHVPDFEKDRSLFDASQWGGGSLQTQPRAVLPGDLIAVRPLAQGVDAGTEAQLAIGHEEGRGEHRLVSPTTSDRQDAIGVEGWRSGELTDVADLAGSDGSQQQQVSRHMDQRAVDIEGRRRPGDQRSASGTRTPKGPQVRRR